MSMKSIIRINLLAAISFVMVANSSAGPVEAMTTVVVVRHAEKWIESGNSDPMLTADGTERALALAHALKDMPIEAVYSSDFKRTRATADPTSRQAGLETILYDPHDSDGLRDAILKDHGGGTVLVVGHSNTVPALLASFGVIDPPEIDDDRYDDCFVVLIPVETAPDGMGLSMLHLHYGRPAPTLDPGETPRKP